MRATSRRDAGWTLVELILTLVVVAIVMSSVVPFLGRVFARSHESSAQFRDALALQTGMEELVACQTGRLARLSAHLGPEGGVWAGDLTVIENRFIWFDGGVETEGTGGTNVLKVTLENSLGERVTRLFAESL